MLIVPRITHYIVKHIIIAVVLSSALLFVFTLPYMRLQFPSAIPRTFNSLLCRPLQTSSNSLLRRLVPTPDNLNMAWRCSGASNTELIENMFRNGLITDPTVKQAFLKVDRADYAPAMAYEDSPQPIGHGATISAPHMHASAIEHVLPFLIRPESKGSSNQGAATGARRVLDVGSGSGYLTHVLAELIPDEEGSMVVGLEHIPELAELGERNARRTQRGVDLLERGRMRFRVGDGRKGWLEDGRGEWDVIHVGAAAKVVHEELLAQLKAPGCMFIPVDNDPSGMDQSVWRIEKDADGNIKKKQLFGVRYVPLTDAPIGGRKR